MPDETSDIQFKPKISTVLHCIHENKILYEIFLGFTDVSTDMTSGGLFFYV